MLTTYKTVYRGVLASYRGILFVLEIQANATIYVQRILSLHIAHPSHDPIYYNILVGTIENYT